MTLTIYTLKSALLAAFLVRTVSAGSAAAECAWVLWVEETVLEQGRSTVTWKFDRNNIHETRPACESALPRAIDRMVEVYGSMGFPLVKFGESVPDSHRFVRKPYPRHLTVVWPKAVEEIEFVCLPDTIDPRGPKGGRR